VVVLNNHGGIIFNMIDGPGNSADQLEYFITNQKLTAKNLADEFGFDFIKLDGVKKIKNAFAEFFTFDGKTKILELETSQEINKKVFLNYKLKIKSTYQ
jgi:2-succinyl-5-enolpyruvyl-6-hydroxy-3-cyclohexene-1-carboxylate synthase